MRRRGLAPELSALRDDRDFAAALDELDGLMLSEPGTPPGRRFEELVLLIEDYEARRNGYLLLSPHDGVAAHRLKSCGSFAAATRIRLIT